MGTETKGIQRASPYTELSFTGKLFTGFNHYQFSLPIVGVRLLSF